MALNCNYTINSEVLHKNDSLLGLSGSICICIIIRVLFIVDDCILSSTSIFFLNCRMTTEIIGKGRDFPKKQGENEFIFIYIAFVTLSDPQQAAVVGKTL